ncbi:YdcF family protein [Hugenholtzia roseola]|uniref:YdcF family protein n=1 Tax=Hugenholtzia roseola TaxID=1002 RepID=UPI0004278F98|nr:YdcF family protein [Hugenholtzia roseola]
MFFLLSKTLDFLLSPAFWLLLMLLFLLFMKNSHWKRRLLRFMIVFFLIFTNKFIVNEAWLLWEIPPTPMEEVGSYQVGIVLTGVTQPFKSPYDRVYFDKGADRIFHALLLYRKGKIKKIMVCGAPHIRWNGQTDGKQTQDVEQMLIAAGVPIGDIILERKSKNTYENALFAKKMLTTYQIKEKPLLITSAFHLRRARACFEKADIAVDTFSTDFYSIEREFAYNPIPSEKNLYDWGKLIHEWAGYLVYKMTGKI